MENLTHYVQELLEINKMREEIYNILRQFFRGDISIEEAVDKLEDLLKVEKVSN